MAWCIEVTELFGSKI